jgi:hypothetical protein
MNFKNTLCVITFLVACSVSYSQTVTIRGIVVDSLSLASIPNVTIKIKRNDQGIFADSKGAFVITALATDTLLFSSVGYKKFEYPLFDDEDEVLIRMKENYTLLKEVDIYAPVKDKYVIKEHKIVTPSLAEGIFSPFTYFSKTEQEKRKLIKLRLENKKIRTYVQIVNDPDLKDEIMDKFSINENQYYETLAMFNQQNRQAAYMTNPVEIKKMLFNFFKLYTR